MTQPGTSSAAGSQPHDERALVDTASRLLVAELVLDDIAAVQANRKGKGREDAPRNDEDLALDLQAASLNTFIGVLHDAHFALNIDRAIESDACQVRRIALLEQAERDDHQAAIALREGRRLPRQTISQRMMEQGPSRLASASEHTSNIAEGNLHIDNPATSGSVIPKSSTSHECVICGDDAVPNRSLKAPCAHYYCRDCIKDLVERYLHDESLHPLRCCEQPLPQVAGILELVPKSLWFKFVTKNSEYSVPAGSRMYCSNSKCSTFLGVSIEDKERNFWCEDCDTATCSQCKNAAHPGEDCTEHPSTLKLRETATASKWQTCPECHAIVELVQGCYHITCRCSKQFCYVCSARWKTCACPRWHEDYLLDEDERWVWNE